MADFQTAFNWIMESEDPQLKCATVRDLPGKESDGVWVGAHAISGINSHSFSAQFDQINSLPQSSRLPAVKNFYLVQFWNKWYEQLADDELAKRVFDTAVNQGPGTAVRIIQKAINALGNGLVVDGGWGPNTVAAANQSGSPLVAIFQESRIAAYKLLEADPKTMAVWLARAEK